VHVLVPSQLLMISSHLESVKCHFKYLMIDFMYYVVYLLNDRFLVYYYLNVYMQCDLYILVYFDDDQLKHYCLAPPMLSHLHYPIDLQLLL